MESPEYGHGRRAPRVALGAGVAGVVAIGGAILILSSNDPARPDWLAGLLGFLGIVVAAPTAVVAGAVGFIRAGEPRERAIAVAGLFVGLALLALFAIVWIGLAQHD